MGWPRRFILIEIFNMEKRIYRMSVYPVKYCHLLVYCFSNFPLGCCGTVALHCREVGCHVLVLRVAELL